MNSNHTFSYTEPDDEEVPPWRRRTLAYPLRLPALSYARQKTLLKQLEGALQQFPEDMVTIRQMLGRVCKLKEVRKRRQSSSK